MFPTLSFGGTEFVARDLAGRAAKVAGFLASVGITDGDTFAIMLRNQPALIEIMLGARQLGAYFVPLNWHFTAAETAYILRDSGAKLLLIGGDLLAGVATGIPADLPVYHLGPRAPGLNQPSVNLGFAAIDWDEAVERAQPLRTSSDNFRGMVPYTSGTTGQPKGVRRIPEGDPAQVARHMGRMYQQALGVSPQSRCLISAPLYHSAPCSYVMLAARQGAWLRLEPRFDPLETLAVIERFRITDAYLVPTMYVRLLRLTAAERSRYDLSSLRFVVSTGAPCPAEIKRAMMDWWGDIIHETYAASELGYLTSISSNEARAKPGSAGRPIEGVIIRILDEQDREVPCNTVGKIYARQTLMPSFTYINRQSDRDALEHDGFLTVGDIGFVDADGYLFVSDRRSDLVLSGGVNIYPAEIEAQLITMPGIADCAVFGVPNREFGQALVAVIQLGDGVSLTAEQVRSFLATRLAGFKIPRPIVFRAELPREETGKIFKRRLRDEFTQAVASEAP
jgi:long-chain acyl-CoA synthetase